MKHKAVLLILLAFCAALVHAEQVTLRLSSWEGAEGLRIQRLAINEFEVAHPNIKIKIEINDYGAFSQKLLTEYAANVAPDVTMMTFQFFGALASRGALEPLDELCKKTPNFNLKEYYPQIVNAHRFDGKLYVLPRDIAPQGLVFYNKRMFDDAGIPYPDGTWTWDYKERPELKEKDFLWVVHKLTHEENGRKVYGYAPMADAHMADMMSYTLGLKEVDNNDHPTKVLWKGPILKRNYQFVYDLVYQDHWLPAEDSTIMQISGAQEMFQKQEVAMIELGAWNIPNLRLALKPGSDNFFPYDVTLFPAYKDGRRTLITGGSGYSIFSSSTHKKEAWELVRWLSGPHGMYGDAKSGIAQPAIMSLARSSPWIPDKNTPEEMQWPHNRIVTDHAVQYVQFPPASEFWNDVSGNYMAPRMASIWSHAMTVDDAIDQAAREGQERLDTLNHVESLNKFNWNYGLVVGALLLGAVVFWVYFPERHVKRTKAQKRDAITAYKFIAPWIIGTIVFLVGPMVLSFLMSFSDWDIIRPARFRGLENYAEILFQDPRFYISLRVTFLYTFISVPLSIMSSLALALLLNQPIKGMPLFRTCYYVPTVGSAVASVMIWTRLFQADGGLINMFIYGWDMKHPFFLRLDKMLAPLVPPGQHYINWLSNEKTALPAMIIMSLWGFGGVIVLLAGLQGIPHFYYEAAMLDGAGPIHRFRHVTLPLLTPALFFSLVTGFIGSFQNFTTAFLLTQGGPGDATQFYMLHLYNEAFVSLRMGYSSALAWILFFIILGFTMLQFKASKWVYSEN
jgi:ABC-type sugar transport system permease subunit/ABC-type glycerol-3-phosphate transport system substrate-binding protein